MPMYIARLNDGSCLIGEADSRQDARKSFLQRAQLASEMKPEAQILSVRELPKNTYLSRWLPAEYVEDCKSMPGLLQGDICDARDEGLIYQREYSRIDAAHQAGVALGEDEYAGPRGEQWREQLGAAIEEEMQRGSDLSQLPKRKWLRFPDSRNSRVALNLAVRWTTAKPGPALPESR
jgi:hypothetical protein